MSTLTASTAEWQVGLVLGIVVVLVAATIVIAIVLLALRIAKQAKTAVGALEVVRQQTAELGGIAQINDSGVRILHAARYSARLRWASDRRADLQRVLGCRSRPWSCGGRGRRDPAAGAGADGGKH